MAEAMKSLLWERFKRGHQIYFHCGLTQKEKNEEYKRIKVENKWVLLLSNLLNKYMTS